MTPERLAKIVLFIALLIALGVMVAEPFGAVFMWALTMSWLFIEAFRLPISMALGLYLGFRIFLRFRRL